MSLKLNVPVKSFATPISYYKFEIPRSCTVYFETLVGNVESYQFILNKEPVKDFLNIEPSKSELAVKEGDTLHVIVKGFDYKFCIMEKMELGVGSYDIIPGIPYRIAPSNRNLKLTLDSEATLGVDAGGSREIFEVFSDSEIILNCNQQNLRLVFGSDRKRLKVEICQTSF